MTEKITNLKQLENLIDEQYIVMVDFSASWCGPCQAIKPHVESIATQYSDKVKVCVVDIDNNPEIAKQYRVQSVPTFFFFYKGKVVAPKLRGASPKALTAKIEELYNIEK